MDVSERHRILFDKINANNQRRKREEVVHRLPPDLSHVLGSCPCIYAVEIDAILRRFLPFNRSVVGLPGFTPSHYEYAEVAWEDKMLALLHRLTVPRISGKAFLLLEGVSTVQFEGQRFFIPDGPLFVVEFRWAASLLKDLWTYSTGGLILVEQDLRAGVLIDKSSGLLPEDLNPWEIVYEVGLWPVQPDDPGGS